MVKINKDDLSSRAEETALRVLQSVPGLQVVRTEALSGRGGTGPDLAIEINAPPQRKRLVIETKNRGEPRLARAAVNELVLYREPLKDVYCIFVAPYVSPRAAEICRKQNVGYIDLSGNCRLSFDGIFIEREGRPNTFAEKRDLRTLYSPRASRVLRALLCEPDRRWKVAELAGVSEVSLGTVSNVKKLLADREWLETGKEGLTLRRPLELLTEWSESYSFRQNEPKDYYSLKPPGETESALADVCESKNVKYALTSFSAAARMAPAVRYQRTVAYVAASLEETASVLGLRKVSSGANVTLLRPYDEGVFFATGEYDGIRTVCPVQAYLDLVMLKSRGEEAAKALIEEVILPTW